MVEAHRILILHATAGAGHKRAAEALERAIRTVDPTSRVHALDTLAFASRLFQRTYAQTYNAIVKKVPRVWGLLYWGSEREPFHHGRLPDPGFADQLQIPAQHIGDRFQNGADEMPLLVPQRDAAEHASGLRVVLRTGGAHPVGHHA